MPLRRTSGSSGGGASFTSACGAGGCVAAAGKFSHFREYTSSPFAVLPMGVHGSTRVVALLWPLDAGTTCVCAQAGDDVMTSISSSFFIGTLLRPRSLVRPSGPALLNI